MTTPNVPRVVSVTEAARHLGISRVTFYRLLANKEIKTVKVGRRRLVPTREIDRFLEARTR